MYDSDETVYYARLQRSPPIKANRVQIPAGPLPNFRMWEPCRTMSLVTGFSRGSPVSPRLLHTGAAPYSPRFTLIGSQYHDVKSRPNLFAHSPSGKNNSEITFLLLSTCAPMQSRTYWQKSEPMLGHKWLLRSSGAHASPFSLLGVVPTYGSVPKLQSSYSEHLVRLNFKSAHFIVNRMLFTSCSFRTTFTLASVSCYYTQRVGACAALLFAHRGRDDVGKCAQISTDAAFWPDSAHGSIQYAGIICSRDAARGDGADTRGRAYDVLTRGLLERRRRRRLRREGGVRASASTFFYLSRVEETTPHPAPKHPAAIATQDLPRRDVTCCGVHRACQSNVTSKPRSPCVQPRAGQCHDATWSLFSTPRPLQWETRFKVAVTRHAETLRKAIKHMWPQPRRRDHKIIIYHKLRSVLFHSNIHIIHMPWSSVTLWPDNLHHNTATRVGCIPGGSELKCFERLLVKISSRLKRACLLRPYPLGNTASFGTYVNTFASVLCRIEHIDLPSRFCEFSRTSWTIFVTNAGVTAKRLSDKRWSAHYEGVKAEYANFKKIVDAREELRDPTETVETRGAVQTLLPVARDRSVAAYLLKKANRHDNPFCVLTVRRRAAREVTSGRESATGVSNSEECGWQAGQLNYSPFIKKRELVFVHTSA
ncbi:hypothetical protein PR048_014885 [Dryococelus australis]|uniref:Uncharacterized protein n=1 Tax=Dryococelus australis TaxID=614101 RepID=A0ABQ9HFF2_9NEOP|nr:hypothetical protein PR048_014885 [Dryococelus australis]